MSGTGSNGILANPEDLERLQSLVTEVENISAEALRIFDRLRGLTDVNWQSRAATAYRDKVYEIAARQAGDLLTALDQVWASLRQDLSDATTCRPVGI